MTTMCAVWCDNLRMPALDREETSEVCPCGFRVEAFPEDIRTAMLVHQVLAQCRAVRPVFLPPPDMTSEETDCA